MATQVTITKKQENKGARGILDLTSQLSQVLKQFEGLYNKALPETDGLTVETWMNLHGVKRFEKNGKKKGYTPALLMDGWHEGLKEEKQAFIFKRVAAKYTVPAVVAEEWGLKNYETAFRVFTKAEAEKIDGKPISRVIRKRIEENKWSVNTILKGLIQGRNYEKEEEKMLLSELEWEQIDKVYIVRMVKRADGTVQRLVEEIEKEEVTF